MIYKILAIIAFTAQVVLMLNGVEVFGKYWNPMVVFVCGIAVAAIWWFQLLRYPSAVQPVRPINGLVGGIIALLLLGVTFKAMQHSFAQYSPPAKYSDVLPQLTTLMQRWQAGEFPYKPVDVGTHIAYPVYLPLHWLPTGLTADPRVGGYLILAVVIGGVYYLLLRRTHNWLGWLSPVLPVAVLWAYIRWGEVDLPVSFELVIAAYYLILGIGLRERSVFLMTLGLIACLLSRYTLVFWLPLFGIIFWQVAGWRKALLTGSVVAVAALALYFIPFVRHSPEIFTKGIVYHNNAAVAEWQGYGEPPVSWTMERGIHFALHLKELISGNPEEKVRVARTIQAGIMLFLFAGGWLLYRRYRKRVHPYDLLLIMLYIVLLCFYAFGPLTYRYYMVVPMMLSALICSNILLQPTRS
jgi:hypothetical protein